jgi:Putative auto-transporter adhesin, head GIN domain
MKNILLFTLTFLTIGLSSCDDDTDTQVVEVSYDTFEFDRIRLETSSNIRIIQSDVFEVVVRGQKRDVDDTDVDVSNGRLTIAEHGNIDNDQVITIFIPEIRELESLGSSEVFGESQFRQNLSMDLALRGSGEIDMYVETDNLDVELSGSGNMFLEGQTDNLDVFLSGSGWLRSFNLASILADVHNSGSGSVEITVDTSLDAQISGSGDVLFKGHPQLNSQITGSGDLIDAN